MSSIARGRVGLDGMRERTREILNQPLGEVVVSADQAMAADLTLLDQWSVPPGDRKALAQWGLPLLEDYRLVANLQEEVEPAETDDGRRYYSLGTWLDFEVVAASPSGEVWGIPLTNWRPASYFINSSITGFIESAWRWYRISRVVNAEDSVERYGCLRDFFDFIATHDPTVTERQDSLWREVLLSD